MQATSERFDAANLWQRIEEHRQSIGMSQNQLAAMSDVPLSTLRRYLAGEIKEPRLYPVMNVCRAMGTTIDELLAPPKPKRNRDKLLHRLVTAVVILSACCMLFLLMWLFVDLSAGSAGVFRF